MAKYSHRIQADRRTVTSRGMYIYGNTVRQAESHATADKKEPKEKKHKKEKSSFESFCCLFVVGRNRLVYFWGKGYEGLEVKPRKRRCSVE